MEPSCYLFNFYDAAICANWKSTLRLHPHDTIVTYDSSPWCMQLNHKSNISAYYLLTDVEITDI